MKLVHQSPQQRNSSQVYEPTDHSGSKFITVEPLSNLKTGDKTQSPNMLGPDCMSDAVGLPFHIVSLLFARSGCVWCHITTKDDATKVSPPQPLSLNSLFQAAQYLAIINCTGCLTLRKKSTTDWDLWHPRKPWPSFFTNSWLFCEVLCWRVVHIFPNMESTLSPVLWCIQVSSKWLTVWFSNTPLVEL
jgi:hypothetical protein